MTAYVTDPVEELTQAAALLERMQHAALQDLKTGLYWRCNVANFTAGINNAVGGAAGELAALFSPSVALALRKIVADAAGEIRQEGYECEPGCDTCGEHTWPAHNHWRVGCRGFININGQPDGKGDWCACVHIVEALAAAEAINAKVAEYDRQLARVQADSQAEQEAKAAVFKGLGW